MKVNEKRLCPSCQSRWIFIDSSVCQICLMRNQRCTSSPGYAPSVESTDSLPDNTSVPSVRSAN